MLRNKQKTKTTFLNASLFLGLNFTPPVQTPLPPLHLWAAQRDGEWDLWPVHNSPPLPSFLFTPFTCSSADPPEATSSARFLLHHSLLQRLLGNLWSGVWSRSSPSSFSHLSAYRAVSHFFSSFLTACAAFSLFLYTFHQGTTFSAGGLSCSLQWVSWSWPCPAQGSPGLLPQRPKSGHLHPVHRVIHVHEIDNYSENF